MGRRRREDAVSGIYDPLEMCLSAERMVRDLLLTACSEQNRFNAYNSKERAERWHRGNQFRDLSVATRHRQRVRAIPLEMGQRISWHVCATEKIVSRVMQQSPVEVRNDLVGRSGAEPKLAWPMDEITRTIDQA